MIERKETDKTIAALIKGYVRDKKAVENAVQRLYSGEFEVVDPEADKEIHDDL